MAKRWYILRAGMGYERIVRDLIEQMGLECYLPIVKKRVRKFNTRQYEPLLPGLLFVRANADQLDTLRGLPGVTGLLYPPPSAPLIGRLIPELQTALPSQVPEVRHRSPQPRSRRLAEVINRNAAPETRLIAFLALLGFDMRGLTLPSSRGRRRAQRSARE